MRKRRTRIFRWQGIIPIVLFGAIVFGGWTLFIDRIARATLAEAGSKAMGAQFDIADVDIRALGTSVELRGVTLADPFNRMKNAFEVGRIVFEIEKKPLLQKKVVVNRLTIADIRTGTTRATPARVITDGDGKQGGFASRAMLEARKFTAQFKVPLMSLVPVNELKALVLDPTQLKAVQAAIAVAARADSAKARVERDYAALRLQETLDSSAALLTRLQGVNVRTLGVDGARNAANDIRRASARVDSARQRVDALLANARRNVDSLQAGVREIDAARRDDYAYARGLLQLPSFDAPDIGAALFGKVTIDKFQQALYWAELARRYAPPGLLPREDPGPKRLRASGTTVHFVKPESYPRFLLRRADVNIVTGGDARSGEYKFAASDVTSDPAILGKPMLFAVRRTAGSGGPADSLRVTGSLDHTGARPRDVVNVQAAGIALPIIPVPSLPFVMNPGRGSSELRFVLDGDQVTGRWSVQSTQLKWVGDSARTRPLNTMETLVARVLTGVPQLDLTADISGSLTAPKLAVRSNLDRQIADRLRAVAGEEIAKAETRMRAQVDKLVEEKSAPVRARVEELRSDAERRVADARTRLEEQKKRLEDRLKEMTAGVLTLPKLPSL